MISSINEDDSTLSVKVGDDACGVPSLNEDGGAAGFIELRLGDGLWSP